MEQVAVNSMNLVQGVLLTLAALEEQKLEGELPGVLTRVVSAQPKATQYDEHMTA